ncbi:uncharacterized protein LOC130826328 isoform X2 [Amaranthus tricolor]|nr:uncharacterized protein LOC130826328 isoform X2 [Amaranthus tricolor]XP_057547937.1 uncharacterized protein LOC130826328 isoform X2 [Amaranthus tricolor]
MARNGNYRSELRESRGNEISRIPGTKFTKYPFGDCVRGDVELLDILRRYVTNQLSRTNKFRPFNFTRFTIGDIKKYYCSNNLSESPIFFLSHWVFHPTKYAATDYSQLFRDKSVITYTWRMVPNSMIDIYKPSVEGMVNQGYRVKYRLYEANENALDFEEHPQETVLYMYCLLGREYVDPVITWNKASSWSLCKLTEDREFPQP